MKRKLLRRMNGELPQPLSEMTDDQGRANHHQNIINVTITIIILTMIKKVQISNRQQYHQKPYVRKKLFAGTMDRVTDLTKIVQDE